MFSEVAAAARAHNIPMRGYVSCVTHCPYDGVVSPSQTADVAQKLLAMGCFEISLGDTLGRAAPKDIAAMLDAVLAIIPSDKLAGHFHDSYGRALDNIAVSLEHGLRVFDASAGGLGGCPYAPGAAGNVDSGRVVAYLESLGFSTGIDRAKLRIAENFARKLRQPE